MVDHKDNPLAWNFDTDSEKNDAMLRQKKREQFERDTLFYQVFSTEDGRKLLDFLQASIVNKTGYSSHIAYEKAVANMLMRDAQTMLVQSFQEAVKRIEEAGDLETYSTRF